MAEMSDDESVEQNGVIGKRKSSERRIDDMLQRVKNGFETRIKGESRIRTSGRKRRKSCDRVGYVRKDERDGDEDGTERNAEIKDVKLDKKKEVVIKTEETHRDEGKSYYTKAVKKRPRSTDKIEAKLEPKVEAKIEPKVESTVDAKVDHVVENLSPQCKEELASVKEKDNKSPNEDREAHEQNLPTDAPVGSLSQYARYPEEEQEDLAREVRPERIIKPEDDPVLRDALRLVGADTNC